MLLSKKLYGLFFIFLMGITAVSAQFPQQMPAQQTTEVSDGEMEQFALAFAGIQAVEQQVQPKLVKTVQDKGLEVQRFNEIMNAHQNPNQQVDATDDEMEKFAAASQEIERIQSKAQQDMFKAITEEGLTVERYQEIIAAVRNDETLQQKLQQHMEKE